MEKRRITRAVFCFLACVLFAGLLFFLSLISGSSQINAESVFRILTGTNTDPAANRIILDIRLPRVLSAMILGGGLSGIRSRDRLCWASPPAQS